MPLLKPVVENMLPTMLQVKSLEHVKILKYCLSSGKKCQQAATLMTCTQESLDQHQSDTFRLFKPELQLQDSKVQSNIYN